MGAWFGYGLGTECEDLPHFVVLNGGLIPPGGRTILAAAFFPPVIRVPSSGLAIPLSPILNLVSRALNYNDGNWS